MLCPIEYDALPANLEIATKPGHSKTLHFLNVTADIERVSLCSGQFVKKNYQRT